MPLIGLLKCSLVIVFVGLSLVLNLSALIELIHLSPLNYRLWIGVAWTSPPPRIQTRICDPYGSVGDSLSDPWFGISESWIKPTKTVLGNSQLCQPDPRFRISEPQIRWRIHDGSGTDPKQIRREIGGSTGFHKVLNIFLLFFFDLSWVGASRTLPRCSLMLPRCSLMVMLNS